LLVSSDVLTDELIDRCIVAAKAYCEWLEEAPLDDPACRHAVMPLLANLYVCAMQLPEIPDADLAQLKEETSEEVEDLIQRVMDRVVQFPLREYWRIEGAREADVERVQEDAARDLYLVYAGVRPFLDNMQGAGAARLTAAWSLQRMFWADWGWHAVHVLAALQDQLHQEASSDE
jgi:uncharacterized protein DUF5063